MLCSKCKGCLQTEAYLNTAQASHSLAHHQTYQSLEQAIDAGCYICNRFWEALSAQEHVLLSSTVGEGVEPSGAYCSIESVQHYLIKLTLCGEGSAKITERFVLSDYRFWKSEVSDALVNKRGWVLQERFLAPRILHFSKRQLIWECCEKDAAEVYPDGLPLALSTSSDARFKQMDSSDYAGRVDRYRYREADGNSAPHLLWLRIVELYTASALTVPSDKLIACSGIAKRVAEIVQDDYVAGMWRRYLEGELLWMVQGNHQPGRWTRPREYRAPSWSWASIDGPITPGEPRIQDSLITVEDYHLDYWTSDKTAAIRGGWLRLRGVLKKTTLARKSSTPGGGYYWDMMLDNERVNVLEDASPGNTEPRVMLDILQEDFKEENTKGLLFSMCARSKTGDGRELQWSNAEVVDLAVDSSRDGLRLWQAMTNVSPPW
ncbi:hypothetical protein HZS61_007615 [Fusarium oxysporum f. sp. conglutinans]|uniref:Heterokaryon incompatibility domain-containing protein n=1 Tax=Fusarium oxysporum f. sp. conglutinans TaxID=100902 RepID=A0A8H6LAP8_FUSOX|nr:hypothetical protein HZS61_007615 [Fusarium oxysporum f. sp. conglutinans]